MAQQIDMVYEGLQPSYVMQVDIETVRTYSDFLNQMRNYESKLRVASKYAPPPPAKIANIVSAGYDRKNRLRVNEKEMITVMDELEALGISNPADEVERGKPKSLAITYPETERKVYTGTLKCYNCDKPGHLFRNCTEPRRNRFDNNRNQPKKRSIAINTEIMSGKTATITKINTEKRKDENTGN